MWSHWCLCQMSITDLISMNWIWFTKILQQRANYKTFTCESAFWWESIKGCVGMSGVKFGEIGFLGISTRSAPSWALWYQRCQIWLRPDGSLNEGLMSSEGNHQFCRSMLTATSEVQCQTLKSPMTNTWKVVRKVYTDCSSEVGYLRDYTRLTAQVAQVVKGPPSNAGAAGG